MVLILYKKLYQIKQLTNGLASIGLILIVASLIILVILPLSIGLLEFQFFNIEKEQVKIATENAVNDIYESVDESALSKVITLPDIITFETNLKSHLTDLGCHIKPENLTIDFLDQEYIVIIYSYEHHFKSLNFQKKMSVFLNYNIPKDQ